jgi:hypothetical protein
VSQVQARRTPWTTRALLAAYADAWRTVLSGEASPFALALLWAQATLECGRGGQSCWGNNTGNIMSAALWQGDYHVLRNAPECYDPDKLPAGATLLEKTNIACPPGKVAAIPPGGSRFRAYPTLLDGCTDKLRVLARQWPRAIAALKAAAVPDDADAFVLGLVGPPRYFTASSASYARQLKSLSAECMRATPASDWPPAPTDAIDTLPAPPSTVTTPPETPSAIGAATLLRAGEGEHTPIHLRDDDAEEPT